MDIVRKQSNGRTTYHSKKTGKRIDKPTVIARIQSLKIPPAYKRVKISSNKNSKIQAIGYDTKMRPQYIYHKDYIEQQKKLKFTDLIYFGKKIKRIRKDMYQNIELCSRSKNYMSLECVISVILFLIDRCNFRVGCDKYKKLYNSYGVTTLNKSHLKLKTNSIKIEFVGKKGVVNKAEIKNNNVCQALSKLCETNDGEYLFYYQDKKNDRYRVTEKHINNYLKKYHKSLTVKMFRTWSANYILLKEILNLSLPESEKEAKKNINLAVKKAAYQLHHTASVSKNSYMNNEIINLYLKNYKKFKRLIEFFRKSNGNLPSINRLLNLILVQIVKDNKLNY